MALPSFILSADRSRANKTALGILCALMLLQIGLLTQVIFRDDALVTVTPSITLPLMSAPPISISPPPVGQLAAPVVQLSQAPAPGFGPPPIGSFQTPLATAPAFSPAPTPAVPKPRALPPVKSVPLVPGKAGDPVSAMSMAEMVDLAKQVRGLGDMQGALEVLKRADLQYPAAPEVMAETAQCYEQMGLADKATNLWKQLAGMDALRSAGFGDLAKRKLNAPSSLAAVSPIGDNGPKMLSLGACQANRDPATVNGEKVVLRIPILRQGSAAIDPAQVDIDVYFFDRVNGEKIAQTIADEPVSTWGAAPVDWSGVGEEPLNVAYFLPALTPGEIAAHGRRSYHGYVVRLYYQHKIQDVAAEPRDLLDFGSRNVPSVSGDVNPLLPPVTN